MERFLWICLGGAVGSGGRYLLGSWATERFGSGFPYGTLGVNVIGSLLLATLMYVGVSTESLSPTLRMAVTIGVMGGFTTYSTFSFETMRLLQNGAWSMATLNVGLTLLGCLSASFAGFALGRWIAG